MASVRRIAVFRALLLGDLLCATPALRALRSGFPSAHIALVGLPTMREFVTRLSSVDEFIDFPGWPGLPERAIADSCEPARFVIRQRARADDLAVQLHGSGSIVNPLVHAFGARHTAGFASQGTWRPHRDAARFIAWPERGTEVERLLALTDHLGLPRRGLQLDFPIREGDRADALALRAAAGESGPGERPYCVVHPGSQLPSRRWEAGRFAAVADALAERGLVVLLTGSAGEAPLTAAVAESMRHPSINLAGRTGLWSLGALIESAAMLLCNDTGPSHIAAALGTRSVVVSSGGDALRWRPHDRSRHTVLWHDLPCRPCAHVVCPTGHECAKAISVAAVRTRAVAALDAAPRCQALRDVNVPVATAIGASHG